ncbi:GAF domain-containing sensor histidine kinase [Anthocerotibacter panamensis]|uniref:GAF domain-containing sensor histidine kinase n=1 Tax=Anthocerotibacter panamensis TaxID=2857077 RepID=UPI001C403FAD|nr:GAF domain-containing sensor histidine kinase [Anthocerotibacter panamensis]
MDSPRVTPWQQAQQILDILSALSYRTGDLQTYLQTIASGVSQLLGVDWSLVALCEDGTETVLASSLDMVEMPRVYALHGRLIGKVVELGCALVVENTAEHPEYGRAPTGYQAYLGIPLRTPQGQVIGTVCSFHRQPRVFTPEEVRLVEMFAERAATVLDNYRLWQKERQFHELLEAEVSARTQELHQAQTSLVERERLAAIGEFSTMIVHEIRSPLTTISCALRWLKQRILWPEEQEYLGLAVDEANRLAHILSEILVYAKPQVLQLTRLDLNQVFSLLLLSQPFTQDRTIRFMPAPMPAWVVGDQDKLKQVFINILTNACEAIAVGEEVLCQITLPPSQVVVQVQNGGPAIPPELLPRLTEPFFTTKPSGTGLGLAVVKRIVTAHGGELFIDSTPDQGTKVLVSLPYPG